MANYNDPVLQKLMVRRAASNPWGGVSSQGPEIGKYLAEQEKKKLAMGEVGLQSKMNQARIEQMGFEQGMAQKGLGLQQGYLGIAGQNQALKEKMFGLQEKGYGLAERGMTVKEKQFGLDEKGFGIKSQLANLENERASWLNSVATEKIAAEQKNLDLQTYLGLGQAGWAAYEGGRRAKETRAEADNVRDWRSKMLAYTQPRKTPVGYGGYTSPQLP